jgi:predicted Zn-dependent protease
MTTRRATRRLVASAAVCALVSATACGRSAWESRFRDTRSDSEQLTLTTRAVEQYRQRVRLSTDAAMNDRLHRVGRALVDAAGTGPAAEQAAHIPWEFVLVDDPDASMATFPNGAIFVHTALLHMARDDDELAGVLGSAVAHVLLHHASERQARRMSSRSAGMMDVTGALDYGSHTRELAETQQEEADWVGLRLAVEAGWNAEQAVQIYDQLGEHERATKLRHRFDELPTARETGNRGS